MSFKAVKKGCKAAMWQKNSFRLQFELNIWAEDLKLLQFSPEGMFCIKMTTEEVGRGAPVVLVAMETRPGTEQRWTHSEGHTCHRSFIFIKKFMVFKISRGNRAAAQPGRSLFTPNTQNWSGPVRSQTTKPIWSPSVWAGRVSVAAETGRSSADGAAGGGGEECPHPTWNPQEWSCRQQMFASSGWKLGVWSSSSVKIQHLIHFKLSTVLCKQFYLNTVTSCFVPGFVTCGGFWEKPPSPRQRHKYWRLDGETVAVKFVGIKKVW